MGARRTGEPPPARLGLPPALTTKKQRQSLSGREEALRSDVGPPSTSPQCQPTTHTKEKELDRIEKVFSTIVLVVIQVRITGRKCRLPFGSAIYHLPPLTGLPEQ